MAFRRVFVIWSHPLFHESVRLIMKHPNIIWVGSAEGVTTAQEEIQRLHPDTILFEKTEGNKPADVMEILDSDAWNVRIIGLCLDDNELNLYHHEHHTVVEPGDLVQFVLG
jgi:hypothetical protein